MENLVIEASRKTPAVHFDNKSGVLEISGRSIPENAIEFYKPLVNWLEAHSADPPEKTVLKVSLEYFNTSSSKCLLDVFKKLENIQKKNRGVVIEWYYEEDDEDAREAGEDYASILRVPVVTKIRSWYFGSNGSALT